MAIKDVLDGGDEAAKRVIPWGKAAFIIVVGVVVAIVLVRALLF